MAKPFQIFISFRHHDSNGETEDFRIADALNQALLSSGYTVFYSPESVKDRGKSDYRKEIDKALSQAKLLIVVATSPENAEQGWVEYEWGSYFADIKSDLCDGEIISLLGGDYGIKSYPRELRQSQSFEVDEELAFPALLDFVKNHFSQLKEASSEQRKLDRALRRFFEQSSAHLDGKPLDNETRREALEEARKLGIEATYWLGYCYDWGNYLGRDRIQAFRYLTEAANVGYAPAQCELAYFLFCFTWN